jgi:plastocyanin
VKLLIGLIAGALLIIACDAPTSGTPPADSPGQPGTPSGEVEIVDFGYQPASHEVGAGSTVTWTNIGNAPHTVTFQDEGIDSGRLAAGETFEHTFASAGTFEYICTIHPQMRGSLTVTP